MSDSRDPLHFQDAFLKAKRNLMWFCSIGILVFLTEVTGNPTVNSDGAKIDDLTFALLDVTLARDWFVGIIAIYCGYLWWGFVFEQRRQKLFNSEALYADSFSGIETAINGAMIAVEQNSTRIAEEVKMRDVFEQENLAQLIEQFDEGGRTLQKITNSFAPILKETEAWSVDDKLMDREYAVKHPDEVYSALWAVQTRAHSKIEEALKSLNRLSAHDAFANRKINSDNLKEYLKKPDTSKFDNAVSDLNDLKTAFNTLDSSIASSDKAKLFWFDLVPSHGLFTLVLLVTAGHFWLKFN